MEKNQNCTEKTGERQTERRNRRRNREKRRAATRREEGEEEEEEEEEERTRAVSERRALHTQTERGRGVRLLWLQLLPFLTHAHTRTHTHTHTHTLLLSCCHSFTGKNVSWERGDGGGV